jgi:hypothetical protein
MKGLSFEMPREVRPPDLIRDADLSLVSVVPPLAIWRQGRTARERRSAPGR